MSGLSEQVQQLFQSFSLGSASTVGLDIGMSGVKVCELSKTGSQYTMKGFGFSPLPEGSIIDDEVHKKDQLLTAINAAFKQAGVKGKNVCYGLPTHNTVVKKMHAPLGTRQEIEDHVSWEAEQFIPFGHENAVISVHVPDTKSKDGVDVIMVAAKQDQVDNYDSILTEAGLKVKIIDLQVIALLNIFEISYKEELKEFNKGTLLIDLGASSTKILVYKDGVPIFTKAIPIGGATVTEEIQRSVGLSFEEAEDLKLMRDDQGNAPEEISAVIKNVADRIIVHIKDAVSFYTSSSSQERVFRCLITGGNLQLPGIVEGVASATGLSVEILDPLKKIKIKSKSITPEMIELITYVGAVPLGLAVRGYL
jgi:type IV pilus assembly protein PilM